MSRARRRRAGRRGGDGPGEVATTRRVTLSNATVLAIGLGAVLSLFAPFPVYLFGWIPAALLWGVTWLIGR